MAFHLKTRNETFAYFQLWEESQEENSRLRSEMETTRQDLDSTRQQLDSAIQVNFKSRAMTLFSPAQCSCLFIVQAHNFNNNTHIICYENVNRVLFEPFVEVDIVNLKSVSDIL